MLELRDYKIIYDNKSIDFPDIFVGENEFLGLSGNSGCGKTSLLDSLFGYDFGGKVIFSCAKFRGVDLMSIGKQKYSLISYCPQFAQDALNPKLRVKEHISLVLSGNSISMTKEQVGDIMDRLRLSSSLLEHYPYMLSGGQKQRIVLMLCCLKNPKLLVLDEPSSAIDLITLKIIVEFLEGLKGRAALMVVSHNQDFLDKLCHRTIRLKG